ncbi:vitamin B12 ABC transporter ATP-binding protein BtuD [Yersinia aleksiciae]|uniref:Vitamin B12 import ATP-binding protein BtuD n=1 Tax=Yersinia aleksiciae TaxID=263819 RepID=A0A0T9UT74_YERAE|nr:vitamin B12 ABC transporter ATP-binding protein BtuD [Yersinia aleksiciae]MDA5497385.1 vitamin B12 ABC transporter ATP-binding protein BtuD [Yersinia aleksiciae]NIK98398.1 vitamin B12 ABC transporter ATP-binding protein BtuD [Yersinia aleksiciae]WQC72729.1 vitamin B12 ABC transporter ATP-binding protein BtuD [Yersinia aleksiciae]CFQ38538.1 vitamin B12-transporter ATPase [Yersinia aleksiciae]CNL68220.1 vitamin B12-transporter ATPase [Yersinia aleksiciae]
MKLLQLSNLSVDTRLVPFSTQVTAGLQIHLIGPNGAGKSTLLAALAGLLSADGDIVLAGKSLPLYSGHELARLRAYLSQQQSALTMMPVFQYLSLYQPAGVDPDAAAAAIGYLCNQLRLTDKLPRMLSQLSGGEWQRVRLAAVFLQVWPEINPDSKLLLLDEPYTGLDVAQKVALDALLHEFCATGRSAIISAHDLNHTLQQADQVWLMARGNVLAQGDTQQVMQTATLSEVFEVDFQIHSFNQQNWIITKKI